jgi:hypothetical protein
MDDLIPIICSEPWEVDVGEVGYHPSHFVALTFPC